ncbi:MAG: PAS domain S-box protein [Bacteroidetes bacterium]|nr:MAG: PAS domain S-box protein [Bacteroidota bacterium]TAG87053.1 MAG: PAS domain S-box protein [Bacteroidota bacterium]
MYLLKKIAEKFGFDALFHSRNDDATRDFVRGYWGGLGIVGILFLVSYFMLVSALNQQADLVGLVNLIVNQNSLSQEIAKQSLILQDCQTEKQCKNSQKILEETAVFFEKSQTILLKEETRLGVTSPNLDTLHQKNKYAFYPILESANEVAKLSQKLQIGKNNEIVRKKMDLYIQKILYKEQNYTKILSDLASQYNLESHSHIQRVKLYQSFLLGLAFLLLLGLVLYLFPPIVHKLQSYLHKIELDKKFTEEKSVEISIAYQKLQQQEEQTRQNSIDLQTKNNDLMRTQAELTQSNLEIQNKTLALQESYDIIEAQKKLQENQFFEASLNHFSQVMRWQSEQTINTWADKLLSEIVPFVNGLSAILYVYDSENEVLNLVGKYALDHDIFQFEEIKLGENLAGQAAKSLETIYLKEINAETQKHTQNIATETINPSIILAMPVTQNDTLAGVLELTSVQELEEKMIIFLKKLKENIGSNLMALQDQKRINQLFADSQMGQRRLKKSLLKIQENEERFRKLSEVTQEGLVFLQENLIKDVNSVLLKMLGYDNQFEVLANHYINLISPKYRFEIEDAKLLDDGLAHEAEAIKKNGDLFPIEIQARNVNYNNEAIKLISIRDITERKRTQEELEKANRIASLVGELKKKNKNITASIEYAQRIQQAILPNEKVIGKGFMDHFILYIPKDIVSGDFYWYAEKNEHALIAAVDCTGHGVPGAFMSLIGYSNLNKIVIEKGITDPATILNTLDKDVQETLRQHEDNSQSRDGMDIGLCSLNIFEKKLSYAGAYRPMYIFSENGELREFKGNAFPIGGNFKFNKTKLFTQHDIDLEEGDTIYIFSDGYHDQFGGDENKKYMTKQFKEYLGKIQGYSLETQKGLLEQEFLNWKGDRKQMDDILVIGLRF